MGKTIEHFNSKNPGAKLEVTSNRGVITSQVTNAGESNEKTEFRFTGRIKKNKAAVIGTIKLSADKVGSIYPNHLGRIPKLTPGENIGLNSSVKLRLKETIKDPNPKFNKNTVSYLFDLVYTGKEKVNGFNQLKYSLTGTKPRKTVDVINTTRVLKVECGDKKVSLHGEKRKITIIGDPFAPFVIAVNRYVGAVKEVYTDAKGRQSINYESDEQVSILSSKNSNNWFDYPDGEMKVISSRLSDKGRFSFFQDFPRSHSKQVRYSINLLDGNSPDAFSNKTLYSSQGPTWWNSLVPKKIKGNWDYYPRYIYHHLNYPTLTATGSLSGWGEILPGFEQWYCKTLTQTMPTKLTLTTTVNSVLIKVNRIPIPHGASSQTFTKILWNDGKDLVHRVMYDVEAIGSTTLASTGTALIFDNEGGSSRLGADSDWRVNGGTIITLNNIVNTATPPGYTSHKSYRISFDIKVDQWGSRDVNLSLNLASYISITP